jgi:hypothetical protein
MTTIGVRYVKSGDEVVTVLENTSEKDINLQQMGWGDLIANLVLSCDKEIVSKNATENA